MLAVPGVGGGKSMEISELGLEARRRLVEVKQRAEALRSVEAELQTRFKGSMTWRDRDSTAYLYRRQGRVEKSLGPRGEATERAHRAFVQGKADHEARAAGLRRSLEDMARGNRAADLGRVPRPVARVLRRLDRAGVLGRQVCVVGTNALFAYEAQAGIRFVSGLLATDDIDLALDARRNLALAGQALPAGLLAELRRIDGSFFAQGPGSFRAVSASGFMVDLIVAEPRHRMRVVPPSRRRLGGAGGDDDLLAVEVPGLEMIVDAPRFGSVAVAEDGLPVWISAADPRWWAAHKLWLARQTDREPLKRGRDREQAQAVAAMLGRHWNAPDLSDAALSSIPAPLRQELRHLVATAAQAGPSPVW